MAPQQIQALEILLATIPELEQKINEELQENPTLELVESGSEQLVGNPVEEDHGGRENGLDEAAQAAEQDETLATLIQLTENWRDYAPPTAGAAGGHPSREDLERRQYLFDSLTEEPTLQEQLEAQLRDMDGLSERMRQICDRIITALDDRGYLRIHLSDLAIALNADLSEVEQGLAIVQSFDPPGIGARDLRECLLLQLERQGERGSLAWRLVDEYLEAVGRNQIPRVAKELGISPEGVYELLERIRRLNPFPGSALSRNTADFVTPEVFIEKNDRGEWVVRSNRDYFPRVRISPFYEKMLKDPNTPKEVKAYIREKLHSSKLLMRAMEQRRSTIERIAEALVEFQKDFLEHGIEHMRPLVMSQVAERIGVHETTVSRAIANKYVQTPHGLFPFRHFFSTGYRGEDGEQVSSLGIKQKIQALVEAEDPRKPLSDAKLAKLLAEQGFRVARRTVAKYREELGIPPSHMRRSY